MSDQKELNWSKDEIQEIKDNYKDSTDRELSENLESKNHKQILAKRNDLNLTKRPQQYEINKNLLSSPSRKRAWFIGVFLSDGCFAKGSKNKIISFTFRDKEFCKKIRECLDTDKPIQEMQLKEDYTLYQFTITNPSIISDLESIFKYEPTPKSNNISYPDKIEYFDDFFRGYFDGDGTVYLRDCNTIRLEICSTSKQILVDLQGKVEKEYGIIGNISEHYDRSSDREYFKLDYSHRQALRIYDKIYNGGIRSSYKKNRFDSAIKESKDLKFKQWLKYEINFLKDSYLDMDDQEIANKLGRSENSVKRKRWKMRLSKFDSKD